MIKQAYFRGLMKVAQVQFHRSGEIPDALQQLPQQQQKDKALIDGAREIPVNMLKTHSFYKDTPIADAHRDLEYSHSPYVLRNIVASGSAGKFSGPNYDPAFKKLLEYYRNIGRQNRDFYLKQGFRPPKDHKYKTPFPFPNHPKKKQMMEQNQWQVRNTRGPQYSGYA